MKRPIVVTDGDQRAALAVTRSLGRSGERVVVCASSARSLAGASRFASVSRRVTDPLVAPDQFVDDLTGVVREHSPEFVVPISEASLLAVLPRRAELAPAVVPFAGAASFAAVCDKASVLAAAARRGIAVPRQVVAHSRHEIGALSGVLRFPVVIKPARSVADAGDRWVKSGARHVSGADALNEVIARFPDEVFPLLVQERVVGPGVGVFVLLWDGEVRAAFSHRRIREKPPSGGVSVVSESVPSDPALLAAAVALLRDFDWQGVAMVEFKIDEATRVPYLMEVNGRFWGSLQLSIDAGVDFPRILIAAARGQAAPPCVPYTVGARLRWEWGDIDHLLLRFRRSRSALSLPAGAAGRWRALLDFGRTFGRGTRGEVLRAGDPMPFVHETLRWLLRR